MVRRGRTQAPPDPRGRPQEGGWFGEAHEAEVRKAATAETDEERLTAMRTLLAEEARMGMMVGVAVGWALAEELSETTIEEEG